MPQGIPMQFFAQKLWKSGYCGQFHTYSQWFAVNFIISKISQTTVNMCETGHSNLTFTTVEQKIAWEYLEAYLRCSNFA